MDPLRDAQASLCELVEAVRALPYARPRERSVDGLLEDRCGTCSTKHLFLATEMQRRFPDTSPQIVHRVYRLEPADAARRFGPGVADAIPRDGLTDVHRYLTAEIAGQRITLDVTFPGPAWDGRSSLPLACGPGRDHPAGPDPDTDKRRLEAEHCDPIVREPFIAALSDTS